MTGRVIIKPESADSDVKRTVLIVEDSPFILRAMTGAFESMGFTVKNTNAPDVALSLYHNDPRPDLMILDHHLGAGMMTGLDMLEHLDHKVPIIMHSSDENIRAEAKQRGAGFVPKRKGLSGLVEMIQTILASDSHGQFSVRCYGCNEKVTWLAPDGRCKSCTRLTIEEIQG